MARDLFDTKLMGVLTPAPHEVRAKFRSLYAVSPERATDWFYAFSQNTNYIRRDRIARDQKWVYESAYGHPCPACGSGRQILPEHSLISIRNGVLTGGVLPRGEHGASPRA